MKKLKQAAEGLVIILIGVFLLVNTLKTKANPIPLKGWAGVLTEAKTIPVIMSIGILALGCVLFIKQLRGKSPITKLTKGEWLRAGVVLLLTIAYGIAVFKFKFLIPTAVYAVAIFVFLNWGHRKPIQIAFFAALAFFLGVYGMPLLISLRLPKM